MQFIWISLVSYLLVEAYFAARRVARKRQSARYSAQNSAPARLDRSVDQSSDQFSIASPPSEVAPEFEQAIEALVNDASTQLEAPDMPVAEPAIQEFSVADSVSDNPILNSEPKTAPEIPAPIAEMPASEPVESTSSSSEASSESSTSPSNSPFVFDSDVVFDSDTDLTLAASLSVTSIVHPNSSGEVEVPDLIPTDPAISEVLNNNAEPTRVHQPSILEEIAELRPTANAQLSSQNDRTKHFMHALLTGDGTVRVAAVYELGEIAAQGGSESEQIIEQLQQLTQDNDPDVRLQAVMALTKVQQ
ncbi:HEAT repeat domain-containing protein [Cyanobacteria bacterium FACHB-502]|nr:HEAT repeat domain-containing protein [Cyanobacteria bacterium FACHB-502]